MIIPILLVYKILYMNTLRTLISCIFVLFVSMNLPKAQVYHLPNGNFESWNNKLPESALPGLKVTVAPLTVPSNA